MWTLLCCTTLTLPGETKCNFPESCYQAFSGPQVPKVGDAWGNFLSYVAGQPHNQFFVFWLDDHDNLKNNKKQLILRALQHCQNVALNIRLSFTPFKRPTALWVCSSTQLWSLFDVCLHTVGTLVAWWLNTSCTWLSWV